MSILGFFNATEAGQTIGYYQGRWPQVFNSPLREFFFLESYSTRRSKSLRKTGNMLNRHFCACAKPFSSPDHHETSISRAFFIFTHISTSIFYQSILSQSEQNFNKYTKLLGLEKKRTLISAFFLISYILIFYTIIIFPYLFFYFFFPFLRNIKIFHISISII